jgi:beta-glucosidase/6-phospho-beta-glucosidase/beta-galactosidase
MTAIEILGGFESTYMPSFDIDVAETSDHIAQRRADLELLVASGIRTLRYPIRWHRIETTPGHYDWRETDEVMDLLESLQLHPIVDLVHHTSYPRWLELGFADDQFAASYLRYVEAFARRYPQVRDFTLFNEPFSTLLLCGHEAAWPPYGAGISSFVHMLNNVLPAISEASRLCNDLLPGARHVWVDSCEHHTGSGRDGRRYARYANDRRFFVLDALLGRIDSPRGRPFVADVVANGGANLLNLEACTVDIVGLDYYAHCQWHFGPHGGVAPSPQVRPLADLIVEYAHRYAKPCMVTETNIRGTSSDRATWLKYVLEQCEEAMRRGVDLRGICWFPFVDSCDWDTLLNSCGGSIDPVGAVSLRHDRSRFVTSITRSLSAVAHGATSADLPAYQLQEPNSTWLRGHLLHMDHWRWEPPPQADVVREPEWWDEDFRPLGSVV